MPAIKRGVVAHTCDPSTPEAEAGGWQGVQGHRELQSEMKASLNCIMKLCLKKIIYIYIYAIIS